MPTLQKNCTDGILSSFRTRIHSRPRNEVNRWMLHKYIGSPRIVSTRMGMLPLSKSAVIQVVVQLRSIQSLMKILKGSNGKDDNVLNIPKDGQRKLVEYMVLQRMILGGDEKPWMVWGTTQESKVQDVLEEKSLAQSAAVGDS